MKTFEIIYEENDCTYALREQAESEEDLYDTVIEIEQDGGDITNIFEL